MENAARLFLAWNDDDDDDDDNDDANDNDGDVDDNVDGDDEKAALQISSWGVPGYADFCGTLNTTQLVEKLYFLGDDDDDDDDTDDK